MIYQIEFSRQADRQFRDLPSQIQQRLRSKSILLQQRLALMDLKNSAETITSTEFG